MHRHESQFEYIERTAIFIHQVYLYSKMTKEDSLPLYKRFVNFALHNMLHTQEISVKMAFSIYNYIEILTLKEDINSVAPYKNELINMLDNFNSKDPLVSYQFFPNDMLKNNTINSLCIYHLYYKEMIKRTGENKDRYMDKLNENTIILNSLKENADKDISSIIESIID